MELLVSMGIFAITIGFVADLFLAASRQQARTSALSHVQLDARAVVDAIADELREGTIDYRVPVVPGEVALRDATGASVRFRRVTGSIACPSGSGACVQIGRGASGGPVVWAPLTSTDVRVDAFDLRIVPTVDPFQWDQRARRYASDTQPRVTLHLALSAPGGRPGERSSVETQTTIVSRMYGR